MSAALVLRDHIDSLLVKYTPLDAKIFTDFEFEIGSTPLSELYFPLITVFAFCIGIPSLQRFMKNRKSPPLKYLVLVHNIFLCTASALLAFYLALNIFIFSQEPFNKPFFYDIFCGLDYRKQRGHLTLIYYINYLLKYYELLDTILLILKHKPITFLHGYHHPATLVLTWGQLVDSTGLQWMIIGLNLCVHTVMYFYYAMATIRCRMPWKKIVTLFQIVQFLIDLSVCYWGWAMHNFWGQCYGTNRAAIIGIFVLTSYLYLFVDFYNETYAKRKLKQQQQKQKELETLKNKKKQ